MFVVCDYGASGTLVAEWSSFGSAVELVNRRRLS